jgi:long-chain fatty acid transport protein
MQALAGGGLLRAATLGAVATFATGLPICARAGGFALREGSADWMATVFAGDTAKAYDASTVWSNPAGMVRLDANEFDASVNGIFPTTEFSGANYVAPGITTPGTTAGNLIQTAVTAGLYAVWNASPDFKIGFGADSPFGQRITNPSTFVGRYQSVVSSISDTAFTVSASYRINDQFSIGGGPVVDYFAARLTQAINVGAISALTGDPAADLSGSNVGVGYNLGLLYQPTQSLRFGIDYRSRVVHNIDGTQSVFVPAALGALSPSTAASLNGLNTAATTKITLPDSVTLGAYWQATPRLALLSDASWTDWSLLQAIDVTPTTQGVPGTVLTENWRNTFAVSVGANYQLMPQLLLQCGVGFDQSPVTNQNRTSRIPDNNRYELGLGAQYEILPNLTLQVAYAHLFFPSAPVSTQASTTSGVLIGTYGNAADTASVGVKWRF